MFLQVYDVCDVLEPQNSTDEPQGVYEMDLKVVSEALGRTILTIKLSLIIWVTWARVCYDGASCKWRHHYSFLLISSHHPLIHHTSWAYQNRIS